jgi:hypothetical protein
MTDLSQLNEQVARRLGWFKYESLTPVAWSRGDGVYVSTLPAYSTDIMAAWEIVDKLKVMGYRFTLQIFPQGQAIADFTPEINGHVRFDGSFVFTADTPSQAICGAFLKLP